MNSYSMEAAIQPASQPSKQQPASLSATMQKIGGL